MVTHKYNVGDYVRFKGKFNSPTTGLVGREGTVAKITGIAPSYDNKPHYYLDGFTGTVYSEKLFPSLASKEEYVEQEQKRLAAQGFELEFEEPETENEAKWYKISFSAKLTPDDLRAMKKCFFDAMNESMEIYDLENLVIEEA